MLKGVLSRIFDRLGRPGPGAAHIAVDQTIVTAMEHCARGDYAAAGAMIEAAIERAPTHAGAHYLLGLLACHGGAHDTGARHIERALELESGNRQYLAALADARLLQQREVDALALYAAVFPQEVAAASDLDDGELPWKRAHPDWTRTLRRVVSPLPDPEGGESRPPGPVRFDDAIPGHLMNWALVLISRRQGKRAIRLLKRAVSANARLGFAHAALAILQTLNRDWRPALAAATSARALREEGFKGANDLCMLASQLGLGAAIKDLDPQFAWDAFSRSAPDIAPELKLLPDLEGEAFPNFPPGALVCFIACDPQYLVDHATALACSIRENGGRCAIHLHLFNPDDRARSVIHRLGHALEPIPVSVTWEQVDFDRYGGKSVYCPYIRFCRLYQLVTSTENRVVMFDADSLVLGNLNVALRDCRAIGLARATDEPMWHQYLAGLVTFRRTTGAERFLRLLGSFLASNVLAGQGRAYLDQIGLYVCAERNRDTFGDDIEELAIERFCDTLFRETALVWSITQNKAADGPFLQYQRAMLSKFKVSPDMD